MMVADFLSQARDLYADIQDKEDKLQMLRDMATKITPTYSDMPHNATRNTHPMENTMLKAMELEEQLKRDKAHFKVLQIEVQKAVATIPALNIQMVFELRYVSCMTWAEIAEAMRYTERHVYRLHEAGLEMVIIPENAVAPS